MANTTPDDLPVATALPTKGGPSGEGPGGRGIVIDPLVIGVGVGVALLGVAVLAAFLWMVPSAAAREATAACRGLGGYNELTGQEEHGSPALCPGGQPCALPVIAPDFTAVDITGKQRKLSEFRGKVVLVNFWASWCGVCKSEKPSLTEMAREMAGDDFVVLTVASDHTWSDALIAIMQSLVPGAPIPPGDADGQVPMKELQAAFTRALPDSIPFTVVLDPPAGDDNLGPITQRWGIHAVPESALIDRDGYIRAYFVNKRDWASPVAETCLRSVIED